MSGLLTEAFEGSASHLERLLGRLVSTADGDDEVDVGVGDGADGLDAGEADLGGEGFPAGRDQGVELIARESLIGHELRGLRRNQCLGGLIDAQHCGSHRHVPVRSEVPDNV